MENHDRRLGLEQEFFLVNQEGDLSNSADQFLEAAQEEAPSQGLRPESFKPEFVKCMVEINSSPARSLADLSGEYLQTLQYALNVAHSLNLRLYPLSTYPLHIMPVMRNNLNSHLQVRTVGSDRFANASRCTGTHLHLELPPGVIDRRLGIAYDSTADARAETLNLYNLSTALDAALIALSRACPFFEGQVSGLATRTVHYRGSEYFGWQGVYTHLQPVGGLMPYAETTEDLVAQQFHRYYTWLEAMDQAGIERQLFWDSGGELLTAGWNPVRLNRLGTVELRGMDSNYPALTLALITLVVGAAQRVRNEHLRVTPQAGVHQFEWQDDQLLVPEFDYLNGNLLYGAVTEGSHHEAVKPYLNSVLAFVCQQEEFVQPLAKLKSDLGDYQTTERVLLDEFPPVTDQLSREAGLDLVRHCCDQLEHQVQSLTHHANGPATSNSVSQAA